MNAPLKTQAKVQSKSNFTPISTGLLQRKCACGNHAMGGRCEECSKKKRFGLQAKLRVNEPGDSYEREADRIAAQVMTISARPASGDVPLRIQRFSGEMSGQPGAVPDSVHQTLASLGRPLDPATCALFEPRFGHDFSQVRVHADAQSAESARAVNALAYTVGRDVAFGAGQYAPGTAEGRRLLAHELTHVVQQRSQQGSVRNAVMRQSKEQSKVRAKFNDCTGAQPNQIQAATEDARKALNRAAAVIGSAYGRPVKMKPNNKQLLIYHFHTTSKEDLRKILGNYISIQRAFETGLEFQCEETCPRTKEKEPWCGYAYNTMWFGGFGDIHVCFEPAGCDFATMSANEQAALIIHEAAHRHAGIADKAYKGKKEYENLSSEEALDNADSYAWFAVLL